MIEGYEILQNGVIHQLNPNIRQYDSNYINQSYNQYGEFSRNLSWLRLGCLLGCINYIPKSIMDVGYGNGDFLNSAKTLIPLCYGNEINGYDIPKGCTKIENLLEVNVDVITFFDSLEHFNDITFINQLSCKYIMISVPNCEYKSDDWFTHWKHRRPNEHLWHFNLESLSNFMFKNDFNLIHGSYIEDSIRRDLNNTHNILTTIFKKNDSND